MDKSKKTFNYHWDSGYIAEEAQVDGQYHLPTFPLLKYTEGEATGGVSVRFCHYGHNGVFRRSPLMMSTDEIEMMREALRETPRLRELLKGLVRE